MGARPGGSDTAKINPPLREAADREALWAGILSGAIDTVATDHVHRGLDAKAGGIWSASPGCPGLETLLPVLLTEGHHARGLDLARVVDLVSTRPAQIMGLAHRKGAIAPGLDADFALVDLDAEWTLSRDDVRSSAGYSIYEGRRFRGRVLHTVVRGRMVLRDRTLPDDSIGTAATSRGDLLRLLSERRSYQLHYTESAARGRDAWICTSNVLRISVG